MLTTGVNYPWRHYGGDFGPTVWGSHQGIAAAAPAIAADLCDLAAAGVEVVRWFVFTDGRGGLAIDDRGWPAGFRDGTLADVDTLCALAIAAGVRLVPVLFDHTLAFGATRVAGATVGGHRAWLAEPEGQSRLIDTVIAPLAARYGPGGTCADLGAAVFAWDLLNEPDWLVTEMHPARQARPMPFDVLAVWIRDAAAVLHRAGAAAVTVGGARLRFASWWDDARLGLDFVQTHAYYDPAHDLDLLRTSPAALRLTRPLVVGEFSAQGDAADSAAGRPRLDAPALAELLLAAGCGGAWPWSWRGVDGHGAISSGALRAVSAATGRARTARGLSAP